MSVLSTPGRRIEAGAAKDKNVYFISLGCPKNLVDSEVMLGLLKTDEYGVVQNPETADVIVVNTCSFIESSKVESIDTILEMAEYKDTGKCQALVVAGCLPQRYKELLKKELPEVDAFVGKISLNQSSQRFPITPKHFAYLKICEGCVNNCSFCIIPQIKGKFVSLKVSSILQEVAEFNRQRLSELNIIGQDISGYGLGLEGKEDLASLIRRVAKIADKIHWIRLLYLNPSRITDRLLAVIRDEPKVCKYIDIPIQHINSRVLKSMNRRINKNEIVEIITKIRKTIPGVVLRTSIIVGFPGETEKEFNELVQFIKEIKFERLGAFAYSREEGTAAYNFKAQVPERIKSQRLDLIMTTQRDVSKSVNDKLLGKTLEVLVDEEDNNGYLGRTQHDAPEVDGLVYINSRKKLLPGDFVKVNINDTLEYDLVGEVE